MCFSRRQAVVSLKKYEQVLEQVSEVRFLGVTENACLTWREHIAEVTGESKKVNNLLRCLAGLGCRQVSSVDYSYVQWHTFFPFISIAILL